MIMQDSSDEVLFGSSVRPPIIAEFFGKSLFQVRILVPKLSILPKEVAEEQVVLPLQVFSDNLARADPRFQPMQRLVKAHLSPAHKDELHHHTFRAKQIFRLAQIVLQKCHITEVKRALLLRLRRINLAVKVIREADERAASSRQ